jgi:integrase
MKPYTRSDGKLWARMRIGGKAFYLGPWGSEEAEQGRDKLISSWLLTKQSEGRMGVPGISNEPTVAELLAGYDTEVILKRYQKNGKRTPEAYHFVSVFRITMADCGKLPVPAFTSERFEAIREKFVAEGWSRGYVNDQAKRLRRVFRWGKRRRLVSADLLSELQEVPALAEDETDAIEHEPKEPPPDSDVIATVKHLVPVLAALVKVQRLTGMRPGELVRLSIDQLQFDADPVCWLYERRKHKTKKRGKRRRIWIGPQAQVLMLPWVHRAAVSGNPVAWVFPVDRPNGRGDGAYRVDSYQHAVKKACRDAGVPEWCPSLMRSARLTDVALLHGPLEAQATGSHSRLNTTSIYLRRQDELAKKAAGQSG